MFSETKLVHKTYKIVGLGVNCYYWDFWELQPENWWLRQAQVTFSLVLYFDELCLITRVAITSTKLLAKKENQTEFRLASPSFRSPYNKNSIKRNVNIMQEAARTNHSVGRKQQQDIAMYSRERRPFLILMSHVSYAVCYHAALA